MQDDRAAFEQRNSVVAVARHLAERLFLEVVGRAFCRGIELSHGIGNAGFLERPARAQVADRVERSLYERANGYNYEAVKIFMPAGSKQPVIVHYTEHCPPDVAAAFIWLKNRDPERWRDVQNVEHAIGKYIISDHPLTEEEWAKERATIIDEKVVEELSPPAKKPTCG
jgi:hypothetical protein